ncbi:MAG: D-2-hydroxyacid dehydrogenase [Planctomycetaceae bacterium]
MKLVIYPPIDTLRLERVVTAAGSMIVINAQSLEVAEQEIVDADAFFGKLTPALLRRTQSIRWVQSPTASLEHYLFPELIAHPLTLTNMRGIFSDVIADHVMGYILTFARNLHLYLRQQIRRHWEPIGGELSRSSYAAGPGVMSEIDRQHQHLSDCTLGVVGVGAIGSEVCRRAAAFGMKLLAVDPQVQEVADLKLPVWNLDHLDKLLSQSDYVVIAAPHTPETAGMFSMARFQQMKRSAVLINIGRGAIVSLHDLTKALQTGTIAGAALDVFETEPLPPEHPLWGMENVLITPHIAAASPRITERHTTTLLENIHHFTQGSPLINVVNKSLWY